ncbi:MULTISPECIES: glutamate racemase [Methylomonas]|uniref:Glutamate racemase n=2 Tax=Methylomonas TaxID=416 RepID=A0A126T2R0_9GAMM|nr:MULTISPECIES: glutamate racemase [Methylomonas]AMK76378.1 glutamate racemase [Methylomonas denitrificans]OAI00504.1 glutamate racemase [Methylomonas methanica]TCV88405.1 glutamate racemase [Methylomonas methanica]
MTALRTNAPIGVFDSGVGGLSVLRAIRAELPMEDLLYVADSGYAPYGDRDADFIADRATTITELLLDAGVKAIVVACNTATVVAIEKLRAWCPVPVVAMEPAIKPAAQSTKSGVVGVLATSRTLASPSVARLCAAYGKDIEILLQPCPGLVEQVEKAQLHSDTTRELLVRYLSPLLRAGADTIVLGCTHYPFLAALIREIVGPNVAIIDPATAVAKELARRLQGNFSPVSRVRAAEVSFFSSTAAEEASLIISALWGSRVLVYELARSGKGNQINSAALG